MFDLYKVDKNVLYIIVHCNRSFIKMTSQSRTFFLLRLSEYLSALLPARYGESAAQHAKLSLPIQNHNFFPGTILPDDKPPEDGLAVEGPWDGYINNFFLGTSPECLWNPRRTQPSSEPTGKR